MIDGIYFNLPESVYLALERVSKSGLKRMRVSPADFWHESWLNPSPKRLTPEQEARQQAARVIGRAYHCARLEPEKFASTYVRALTMADYAQEPGFLSSGREIEAALVELGEVKKKAGEAGVLDQAKRLKEKGYSGPIWHLELEKWASNLAPHQLALDANVFDEIAVDMARLKSVPAVEALLTGGAAEVSVLWTCPQTGLPMKARFDYLKADRWVEFKTFANPNGKNLLQTINDAIRFNRYHIDAAAYMEAAEAIRLGGLDIVGKATDDEINIITAIKERPVELGCHFVFQQKGGVPNILERSWRFFEGISETAIRELEESNATPERLARARNMQQQTTRQKTAIYTKGRLELAAAKRDFIAFNEIYERGEPWLPFNPSGEITDEDFSQYFLEEAI